MRESDNNIPDNARDSGYWYEEKEMPYETDESYLEVDDVIDRSFLSNRDTMDEHYPDTDLV